jgi:hypothetical protein
MKTLTQQLTIINDKKKWHQGIINTHTDKLRVLEQEENELLKKLNQ